MKSEKVLLNVNQFRTGRNYVVVIMNTVVKALNVHGKSAVLSGEVKETFEMDGRVICLEQVGSDFSGSEERKSNSPSETTIME